MKQKKQEKKKDEIPNIGEPEQGARKKQGRE